MAETMQPTNSETSPPARAETPLERTLDLEGAASMGMAGWLIAAELLTRMRELGLLSTEEATGIIARAHADAEGLGGRLKGPSIARTRNGLARYLASWRSAAPAKRTPPRRRVSP
jgi:hypothetical protein